jgi:hypothetical protein
MLDAAKERRWREGPLVEINNSEELKSWLRQQLREVSVAFAARAALRVAPVSEMATPDERYWRDIVLPSSRATAVSWAAARYPARETELAARIATAAFVAVGPNDVTSLAANAAAQAVWAAAKSEASNAAARSTAYAAEAAARAANSGAGYSDGFNLKFAEASGADPVTAAFWSAVSFDATRVEDGATASDIAGSPLWPEGQPDRFQSWWQESKAALHAEGQDWQVWANWYDDRLAGRVRDEEYELAYVRIEEALWDQGPAAVNAEIKRRIEELEPPQHGVVQGEARGSGVSSMRGVLVSAAEPAPPAPVPPEPLLVPEIPPHRPAALEPVWSNGKLVLPTRSARTDGDKRTNVAALKALRAELIELGDDVEAEQSNFDKRIAPDLRRIAERISGRPPPQHELFRLAHVKEYLQAYGTTVNDQWPDHLAARYHALTLHIDRTVRQFTSWKAFVRNAEENPLSTEQAAKVPAIAVEAVSAMRDDDAKQFIDREIPEALEQLPQPPQGIAPNSSANPLVLEDVVESLNNIVKEAVAAALDERAKNKEESKPRPARAKVAKGFGDTAKEAATGYRDEAQ